MFSSLRGDVERLVDEAIWISYYMRGAMGYEEVMRRTPGERQRLTSFLEKRLESQSKSLHPVY